MSQDVIIQWLDNMSKSVAMRDLEKQMSLISRYVQVYGVPGHDVIDYDGWRLRRRNEFQKNLLAKLSYKLLKVKIQGLRRTAFQVEETMTATGGSKVILTEDIMLELEPDDRWRLVELKIRHWNVQE